MGREGSGVGNAFEGATGTDRQHQLGQNTNGYPRLGIGLLVHPAQQDREPVDRTGMQLGVPAAELRLAGGVRPELDDQERPVRLALLEAVS